MPRPRIIRVRRGTVTVKNLSARETDDIERFLTTPFDDRREVVFNPDKYEWEIVPIIDPFHGLELSQTALGFFSDESGHYAVEILYDPKGEVGKVIKKIFLHKNINHARNAFQLMFNKRFI